MAEPELKPKYFDSRHNAVFDRIVFYFRVLRGTFCYRFWHWKLYFHHYSSCISYSSVFIASASSLHPGEHSQLFSQQLISSVRSSPPPAETSLQPAFFPSSCRHQNMVLWNDFCFLFPSLGGYPYRWRNWSWPQADLFVDSKCSDEKPKNQAPAPGWCCCVARWQFL